MGKTDNLKPFVKGQSGNLAGRPKKLPGIDELLAEVMAEPTDGGIETAKAIVLTLVKKALKGDTTAAQMLLDRAYGKARQSVDLNAEVKQVYTVTLDLGEGNILTNSI